MLHEKTSFVPVGLAGERSVSAQSFPIAPFAGTHSERLRRLALASSFDCSDRLE